MVSTSMIVLKNVSEEIHIIALPAILGRDRNKVDYVISHASVSGIHCIIDIVNDRINIEDLDSTNGTLLNNVRLRAHSKYEICAGNTIKLGNASFRVVIHRVPPKIIPRIPTYDTNDVETVFLDYNGGNTPFEPMFCRWINTSHGGDRFIITQTPFYIGKNAEEVDYQILDHGISKRHIVIVRKDDQFYIQDLASTNGVYLNGKKIRPLFDTLLSSGDVFKIGAREYSFEKN